MSSYVYSLSGDFTASGAIQIFRFVKQVQDDVAITTALANIEVNGDAVTITSISALSGPEITALNIIIANHIPGSPRSTIVAVLTDSKSSGTAGGTFTSGSWQNRDLNTVAGFNVDFWITLSANTFTLDNGIYYLTGTAAANNVGNNQLRIYNNTTSTVEFYGENSTSGTITRSAPISGFLNVTAGPCNYSLQHQCSSTQAVDGYGAANSFGGPEIYTTLHIKFCV